MLGYVLANFFVYAGVNAFTPGPGNILALNTVTNYGWGKGKPLFFGIFAGHRGVQNPCYRSIVSNTDTFENTDESTLYLL